MAARGQATVSHRPRPSDSDLAHAAHAAVVVLSALVPAYNAERCLASTVVDLVDYLRSLGLSFEVVIIDDGSTDRTPQIAAELARAAPEVRVVSLRANRGKGAAVKAGQLASRGERVVFMDADGATDVKAIPAFLAALESNDVAIASRHHPQSVIGRPQPVHRRLMGLAMRELVKRTTGIELKDTQCGFKMFTRPAAELLFGHQQIDRFAFDVELCYLARLFELRIVELPITWRDRAPSTVRLLRDPLDMVVDVLRMRHREIPRL